MAEQGTVRNVNMDSVSGNDDDDDWEGGGVYGIGRDFQCRSVFVAAAAADRLPQKVSSDVQLQLYGFYNIATEEPCSAPPPSGLKMTARTKWYSVFL